MSKIHENNGACIGCINMLNAHPSFNLRLSTWFKEFQSRHPEAHISCAGRGRIEQEILYQRRATRAHYPQSAHNWGAAIDIFCNNDSITIFPVKWFYEVLRPEISIGLTWYGSPGAEFYEMPHIEVSGWSEMAHQGLLTRVE